MVFLQHLYGRRSLFQTTEDVSVNIAFRWFIGYNLLEETPQFSNLSYNFKHRFGREVFEKIFTWVLEDAVDTGYVKPEVIFAKSKKQMKEHIPTAVKAYAEQLYREINCL